MKKLFCTYILLWRTTEQYLISKIKLINPQKMDQILRTLKLISEKNYIALRLTMRDNYYPQIIFNEIVVESLWYKK